MAKIPVEIFKFQYIVAVKKSEIQQSIKTKGKNGFFGKIGPGTGKNGTVTEKKPGKKFRK